MAKNYEAEPVLPDLFDLALLQQVAEDREVAISFQVALEEFGFDLKEFQFN